MEIGVINGDSAIVLPRFESECVDLTVTSPPYDNLRQYEGYCFDFQNIACQLFRVTKPGGVVVWVVADATQNGSETGTSFQQALFFMRCGFRLHDTMIYHREGPPLSHNRYEQKFEYMFVFSKGKPKTFNGLRDISTYAGQKRCATMRQKGDSLSDRSAKGNVAPTKLRGNVWTYGVGKNKSTRDADAFQHPAIFPESLAEDHILSWSNPGEIVLDPFSGAGTTGKMAVLNARLFVGIEVSAEYCAIATQRIYGGLK